MSFAHCYCYEGYPSSSGTRFKNVLKEVFLAAVMNYLSQLIQLGKREVIVETTTRYRTIGRPSRSARQSPSAFCTLPRTKPGRPPLPKVSSTDPGRRKVETLPARGQQQIQHDDAYWRTKEPVPWHPKERAAWRKDEILEKQSPPAEKEPAKRSPSPYAIPEEPPVRRVYPSPWQPSEPEVKRSQVAPVARAPPKHEPYSWRSEERSYKKEEYTPSKPGTVTGVGMKRPDGSVAPVPWRPYNSPLRKTDALPWRASERPAYWLMDSNRRYEPPPGKEEHVRHSIAVAA